MSPIAPLVLAVAAIVVQTAAGGIEVIGTVPIGFASAVIDPSSLTASEMFRYYAPVYVPAAVLLIFIYVLYKFIRYSRCDYSTKEVRRR